MLEKFLSGIILVGFLWSCGGADTSTTGLTPSQKDSLLVNMITYMDSYAPEATNSTRFEKQFRPFYQNRLPLYTLEDHHVVNDSLHYFFVIRPVGGGKLFQRGVGGRFVLKKGSVQPEQFEEMWCTPHFKEVEVIKERGNYLFKEMLEKGSIDHLLSMKHYIEWPDSTLVYDKNRHEWVSALDSK